MLYRAVLSWEQGLPVYVLWCCRHREDGVIEGIPMGSGTIETFSGITRSIWNLTGSCDMTQGCLLPCPWSYAYPFANHQARMHWVDYVIFDDVTFTKNDAGEAKARTPYQIAAKFRSALLWRPSPKGLRNLHMTWPLRNRRSTHQRPMSMFLLSHSSPHLLSSLSCTTMGSISLCRFGAVSFLLCILGLSLVAYLWIPHVIDAQIRKQIWDFAVMRPGTATNAYGYHIRTVTHWLSCRH